MRQILSFKHWQLFLLIFIGGTFVGPSPLREIINAVAIVTFTLWIYAIGTYGQEQIATLGLNKMNLQLFKANLIFVVAFFSFEILFTSFTGETGPASTDVTSFKDILDMAGGFYAMFAIIQMIVFVCKTIAKLEYRREVKFDDYIGNLLLLSVFFIGIWILQPKVNRLLATEQDALV